MNKQQLIQALTQNRDSHKAIFEDARRTWNEDLTAAARALAEAPDDEDRYRDFTATRNAKPVSYEDEYNDALRQLDFELRDTLELTIEEFNCFVSNRWEWRRSALSNKYFSGSFSKMST